MLLVCILTTNLGLFSTIPLPSTEEAREFSKPNDYEFDK